MNKINQIFSWTLFVLLSLSFVTLLPKIVYSQEVVDRPVLEFAQKSLQDYLKNFVNEKNFANFGFKNFKEIQVARLGQPYRIMVIPLGDLKTYKSGTGAKPLLMDVKMLWFPVIVEGKTRTKLEIIEKEGKQIAGEFGGIRTVQKIAIHQDQLPKLLESREIEKPYNLMLVKIPALYAMFLYIESPKGEFLVPTMTQPQKYELEDGKIYTADEVLSKLREFAEKIDEKKLM